MENGISSTPTTPQTSLTGSLGNFSRADLRWAAWKQAHQRTRMEQEAMLRAKYGLPAMFDPEDGDA